MIDGSGAVGTLLDHWAGNLTLDDVTLSGGRLTVRAGSATVTNATLANGVAPGIYNYGDLTVTDTTVSGLTNGYEGGGIRLAPGSVATINRVNLLANSASFGEGPYVESTLVCNMFGDCAYSNPTSATMSRTTMAASAATTEGGGLWAGGDCRRFRLR